MPESREFGSTGRWCVLAAATAGSNHSRLGHPCQDAYAVRVDSGGVLVAAVADGAGSATLAEVGARLAAQEAVNYAVGGLGQGLPSAAEDRRTLLRGALRSARNVLEQETAERDCQLRDLATTLIVTLATTDQVAVGQVGDGGVVAQRADLGLVALTTPTWAEYVNETCFLTGDDYLETSQIVVQAIRATGVAVFSDGLQMLALTMPEKQPYRGFFTPLFQFARDARDRATGEEHLRRFLQSDRVAERSDDDRTLVLAVLSAS